MIVICKSKFHPTRLRNGIYYFQTRMWNLLLLNAILFLFILLSAPAGTGVIMSDNKHLTLDNRYDIQHSLDDGLSFKAIATNLGKDCSTISKEVKRHIIFEKKGAPYRPFNDCIHRFHCQHNASACQICSSQHRYKCSTCGKCTNECHDYAKESCARLQKPPYVCNGCPKRSTCTLEKHLYHAHQAHMEYMEVRSESRSGFNLTKEELQQLDSIISPLIQNGQSLHHILKNNPDTISCCLKTAYRYADNGLFQARNIDMPRKVRFRPRKKKSVPLKVDKACRRGRTYEDFKKYREENPSLPVVQIDSVEGIKGGAVLLTVHFALPRLQLSFLRKANDSRSVTDIFNHLYEVLGETLYKKLFPIVLADNGTEFSDPEALEKDNKGNLRSRVFYCDPSAPGQKGACENNHEFIRRVIPKGTDIGLYSESQIKKMMNHINSYGRPELGDKSPFEMFSFYYGLEALDLLGVKQISPNEIILKPDLLKENQGS